MAQADLAFSPAVELRLPALGQMVALSPAFSSALLKGIKLDPKNPLRFHFFVDRGDSRLSREEFKTESAKLIKYFLASLTIPEKDLWVNLSPYEKDRIVPKEFGQTEMGRDLLAEDYILKQITASLIYPESQLGKKFWNMVYAQVQAKYGTTNIPINTFNKVWIVPQKAVVYENGGVAFVLENHLKVMLEEDYLSLQKHQIPPVEPTRNPDKDEHSTSSLGSQIIREIVIPALTREVNEGKNFAQLRQVFYSLILATWYKGKIKESILAKVYENKKKIAGVGNAQTSDVKDIYQQYLQAFKKGVFNYIKEEADPMTNELVPRKYFSGGIDALKIAPSIEFRNLARITSKDLAVLSSGSLTEVVGDMAMLHVGGILGKVLNKVRANSDSPRTAERRALVRESVIKEVLSHQIVEIPVSRQGILDDETRWWDGAIKDMIDAIESHKAIALDWSGFSNDENRYLMMRKFVELFPGRLDAGILRRSNWPSLTTPAGFSYCIQELLTNAFVHGNKAKFDEPVFLYFDTRTDGRINIATAVDMARPEKLNADEIKQISNSGLSSLGRHGAGIDNIEFLHRYHYERLSIYHENTQIGSKAIVRTDEAEQKSADGAMKAGNANLNKFLNELLSSRKSEGFIKKGFYNDRQRIDIEGNEVDHLIRFNAGYGDDFDKVLVKESMHILIENALDEQKTGNIHIKLFTTGKTAGMSVTNDGNINFSVLRQKALDLVGKIYEYEGIISVDGSGTEDMEFSLTEGGRILSRQEIENMPDVDLLWIIGLSRGKSKTKGEKGGLGEGLGIVKGYLKNFEGQASIEVQTEKGRTTFSLFYPADRAMNIEQGGPSEKRLSAVEAIHRPVTTINGRDSLIHLIEEPLLKAAQILYDKNIETLSASANQEHLGSKMPASFLINFDTLSEQNQSIALKVGTIVEDFRFKNRVLAISIPYEQEDPLVSQLSRQAEEIVNRFQPQRLLGVGHDLQYYADRFVTPQLTKADLLRMGFVWDLQTGLFYTDNEEIRRAKGDGAMTTVDAGIQRKDHRFSSPIQVIEIAVPNKKHIDTELWLQSKRLLKKVQLNSAMFDNDEEQRFLYIGGHLDACINNSLQASVQAAHLFNKKLEIMLPLDQIYIGPEDFNGKSDEATGLKRQYAENLVQSMERYIGKTANWVVYWDQKLIGQERDISSAAATIIVRFYTGSPDMLAYLDQAMTQQGKDVVNMPGEDSLAYLRHQGFVEFRDPDYGGIQGDTTMLLENIFRHLSKREGIHVAADTALVIGYGNNIQELKDVGSLSGAKTVIGVEYVLSRVLQARKQLDFRVFQLPHASAEDLTRVAKDSSIDLVVGMNFTVGQAPSPKIASEVIRVLRPGGLAILSADDVGELDILFQGQGQLFNYIDRILIFRKAQQDTQTMSLADGAMKVRQEVKDRILGSLNQKFESVSFGDDSERSKAKALLGQRIEIIESLVSIQGTYADKILELIDRFIDVPGIERVISKFGKAGEVERLGTFEELYHASLLQQEGYEIKAFDVTIRDNANKEALLQWDLVAWKDGEYYCGEVKDLKALDDPQLLAKRIRLNDSVNRIIQRYKPFFESLRNNEFFYRGQLIAQMGGAADGLIKQAKERKPKVILSVSLTFDKKTPQEKNDIMVALAADPRIHLDFFSAKIVPTVIVRDFISPGLASDKKIIVSGTVKEDELRAGDPERLISELKRIKEGSYFVKVVRLVDVNKQERPFDALDLERAFYDSTFDQYVQENVAQIRKIQLRYLLKDQAMIQDRVFKGKDFEIDAQGILKGRGSLYSSAFLDRENEISSHRTTIAFDLDGTILQGKIPFEGIEAELKKLQDAGYRLVLWTSRNQEGAEEFIDKYPQLAKLFDLIIPDEAYSITSEADLHSALRAYKDRISQENLYSMIQADHRAKDIRLPGYALIVDDAANQPGNKIEEADKQFGFYRVWGSQSLPGYLYYRFGGEFSIPFLADDIIRVIPITKRAEGEMAGGFIKQLVKFFPHNDYLGYQFSHLFGLDHKYLLIEKMNRDDLLYRRLKEFDDLEKTKEAEFSKLMYASDKFLKEDHSGDDFINNYFLPFIDRIKTHADLVEQEEIPLFNEIPENDFLQAGLVKADEIKEIERGLRDVRLFLSGMSLLLNDQQPPTNLVRLIKDIKSLVFSLYYVRKGHHFDFPPWSISESAKNSNFMPSKEFIFALLTTFVPLRYIPDSGLKMSVQIDPAAGHNFVRIKLVSNYGKIIDTPFAMDTWGLAESVAKDMGGEFKLTKSENQVEIDMRLPADGAMLTPAFVHKLLPITDDARHSPDHFSYIIKTSGLDKFLIPGGNLTDSYYSFSLIDQDHLATHGTLPIGLIMDFADSDVLAVVRQMSEEIGTRGRKSIEGLKEFLGLHRRDNPSNIIYETGSGSGERYISSDELFNVPQINSGHEYADNNEVLISNNGNLKAKSVVLVVSKLHPMKETIWFLKNHSDYTKVLEAIGLGLPVVIVGEKGIDLNGSIKLFKEAFPDAQEMLFNRFVLNKAQASSVRPDGAMTAVIKAGAKEKGIIDLLGEKGSEVNAQGEDFEGAVMVHMLAFLHRLREDIARTVPQAPNVLLIGGSYMDVAGILKQYPQAKVKVVNLSREYLTGIRDRYQDIFSSGQLRLFLADAQHLSSYKDAEGSRYFPEESFDIVAAPGVDETALPGMQGRVILGRIAEQEVLLVHKGGLIMHCYNVLDPQDSLIYQAKALNNGALEFVGVKETMAGSLFRRTDKAMKGGDIFTTTISVPNNGGIDLNPAQMSLQVKKQGEDFKFDFNGTELDAAQVTGVTFTIRTMTPVTDLPLILGLSA